MYVNFIVPGHGQVREFVERVGADGKDFADRLREAKARARDVLIKRRAAIVDERFEFPRSRRAITFADFVEKHYAPDLLERRLCSLDVPSTRTGGEGYRWHDLWHTAACRIVQAGGTLLDAGEHLGHRSPAMTMRTPT